MCVFLLKAPPVSHEPSLLTSDPPPPLPPPAAGKLSMDDLNSLIAHAHRRIDQLNRELAEQRVREQIHIETALEQQKLEHQKALEQAVVTALEHNREEMRLEQEKKVGQQQSARVPAPFLVVVLAYVVAAFSCIHV